MAHNFASDIQSAVRAAINVAGLVPQRFCDGVWVFLLVILPRALPGALVGLTLYYAMSVTFDVHMFDVAGAIRTIEKTLNHERAQ